MQKIIIVNNKKTKFLLFVKISNKAINYNMTELCQVNYIF